MKKIFLSLALFAFLPFFAQAELPPQASGSAVEALLSEDLIHNLRDPFQMPATLVTAKGAPLSDLESIQLKDFHLNGVITGPKKTRAMVTGPNGKSYFIGIGEHIGTREGRVTAITADSVKVTEYDMDERGRKTPEVFELRLNGDVVSMSKKDDE